MPNIISGFALYLHNEAFKISEIYSGTTPLQHLNGVFAKQHSTSSIGTKVLGQFIPENKVNPKSTILDIIFIFLFYPTL